MNPITYTEAAEYLEQMCKDLAAAEAELRSDIDYRGMSFSQARLNDSQANVDRLHGLIRTYLQATAPPQTSELPKEEAV